MDINSPIILIGPMGCGKSTMRVCPPLSLTKDEANEGLMIFEEALTKAESE